MPLPLLLLLLLLLLLHTYPGQAEKENYTSPKYPLSLYSNVSLSRPIVKDHASLATRVEVE
jgi:hypothetical protein